MLKAYSQSFPSGYKKLGVVILKISLQTINFTVNFEVTK